VEITSADPADCGSLPIGSVARREVVLKNTGPHRILLNVVAKSCPCLTVFIDPKELGPGQTASVEIMTDVAAVGAAVRYTVDVEAQTVLSAGRAGRSQLLHFEIIYEPDVQAVVTPTTLHLVATPSRPARRTLVIRRLDGEAVTGVRTTLPGDWISVAEVAPWADNPAQKVVTLQSATTTPGFYRAARREGLLRVFVAGQETHVARVNVSLRVEPDVIALPAGLTWNAADPRPFRESVLLTDRATPARPALTASLERPSPLVDSLALVARAGGRWQLNVTPAPLARTLDAPPQVLQVVIRDASGAQLTTVPLVWFGPKAWSSLPQPAQPPKPQPAANPPAE
jgi:hypothetical protein